MSLDTVRPKDVLVGRIRKTNDYDTQALRTSDIRGSGPTYNYKRWHSQGPPHKEYIPGTTALTHYPERNRPIDMSLTTGDLRDAQPNVVKFKTPRHVNPLTPRYDLASCPLRPPSLPRAMEHEGTLRDTMTFKGHGTPRILERDYARDPNETRDIEFSQPNLRSRLKQGSPRQTLRTEDINGERNLTMKKSTTRVTCPLAPRYENPTQTTHPFLKSEGHSEFAPRESGFVKGSTPRTLIWDNGEPQSSLIREDIMGACPQRFKGGLPFNLYDPPEVTPYSRVCDASDIDFAQAGTRKPGCL